MTFTLQSGGSKNKLSLTLDQFGQQIALTAGQWKCDAYTVYFEVKDDLRNRIFDSRAAHTEKVYEGCFIYRWQEAEFEIEESYSVEQNKIARKLCARLINSDALMRSISFKILVSYPEKVYGLMCFTANEHFPCAVQWIGGRTVYYGDVCYGTLMPFVGYYSRTENAGLTFGTRFDCDMAGRLSFSFRDYHSEGIDIEFSMQLLNNEHPASCELIYAATDGCWRSILAFWKDCYPEFFASHNPLLPNTRGPFLITNPQMPESYLKQIAEKYAPSWAEVHNHFARYGEYAPETEEWESIIRHDYPEVECKEKFTYAKVRKHIKDVQKHNIKALLYLQASGDCFIPYAEKMFPDAIARDSQGYLSRTWKNCCFVSAAPGTSFHKHMINQIERFFQQYDEIDGVFLDQVCYQMIDYAHADGKSADKCRPISRYGDSYNSTIKLIADYLHQSNRSLWGNGPFDIGISRYLDGLMSEGTGSIVRSFQYLTCGSKGLLVHSYAENAADVEAMFKNCLICGGNWSVSGDVARAIPLEYPAKVEYLFEHCGRLVDTLTGCEWCLEVNPFTIPDAYEGNLFVLPDGNLALTVVSKYDSLLKNTETADEPFEISISCSACPNVKSVEIHTTNNISDCEYLLKNNQVYLSVSKHCVMSVVLLKTK